MMPSIYDLKPRFQSFLRPLVRSLAGSGVSANQVTIAALMLSVVVGGLIALNPTVRWPMLLMPGALFIRMALNAIDGMLAREHGMKSPLGAILNEIGDVLSDTALYLPLAAVPGLNPLWVVLVVVLAIISEMTGVIAVQIGSTRRYDGPMGKSDRALVFGVLCLLLGFGVDGSRWADGLMLVTMALLVVTIINRAARALAEVD
jgi:CDP-diacylglycerol--glycerol-3-phosphate 3-phosphatidyltransferase